MLKNRMDMLDKKKIIALFTLLIFCQSVANIFASEEARKIYYGETKSRPIWGESTIKEAKELAEEGISFSQLPWQSKEDA